nr:hypothetical protein [Cohnella cholangitidis]
MTEDDKSATNVIRVVREISWAEMLELANTGKGNTGHSNAGHYNAGDSNAGNRKAGHYNAGTATPGTATPGTTTPGTATPGTATPGTTTPGNRNAGHYNAGHYNAGDFNSCNWSTGSFCSVEPPFLLFNKPSPISRDELYWHAGFRAARQLRVVDGDGNKIEYKQAWANLWNDELGNPERIAIQSIPNFDTDVFFEITGIRV